MDREVEGWEDVDGVVYPHYKTTPMPEGTALLKKLAEEYLERAEAAEAAVQELTEQRDYWKALAEYPVSNPAAEAAHKTLREAALRLRQCQKNYMAVRNDKAIREPFGQEVGRAAEALDKVLNDT